jgi:hypothetical protein
LVRLLTDSLILGLGIPGFLVFEEDKDFVVKENIARGGYGTIDLCSVASARLQEAANGNTTVVAKRLRNGIFIHVYYINYISI